MFSNIKNLHKVLTQRTQSIIFVSVSDRETPEWLELFKS